MLVPRPSRRREHPIPAAALVLAIRPDVLARLIAAIAATPTPTTDTDTPQTTLTFGA